MSCLGVHFALADESLSGLLSKRSDEDVLAFVKENLEAHWDKEWLQETDKAWDAIHRCLTDGTLECHKSEPLAKCILGGRQLYRGNDYIVSFLDEMEVWEVAASIKSIDKDWMRTKYDGLKETDYGPFISKDDFEYTWEWFERLKGFYQKAAKHKRAMLFTADQ
jgi:hypothetical protein